MPVIDPNPIEIPDYLAFNADMFVGFFMTAIWDPIDGIAMVSCPLCAAAIENSFNARNKHSVYHVNILLGIRINNA